MSLREQLFGQTDEPAPETQEQHAEDDIDPQGRQSSDSGFVTSYVNSILGRDEASRTYSSHVGVDVSVPQDHLNTRYQEYVQTVPLVKAPLSLFSETVAEPGWHVSAEIDGEKDEEMEEALEEWGQNCYVHSREPGHDIGKLIKEIPDKRRGKGTIFIEKAGTRGDSESIGGLMMLDPTSIKIYSRENQPILIQPDDDVPPDHPMTEDGKAAAYVQYDNDLSGFDDKEPIAFSTDDIIKITYDPQEGSAFGTPLWVTVRENIDRFRQMQRDREASIRINGHPWRIISNENWTYQEANTFLKKHFDGDISTWRESETKSKKSFVGRMDAIPHQVEVDEHSGNIPDIEDAVMDEVRQIFAVMPISRYLIAYEESINQWIVEPQREKDDQKEDSERGLIRGYIEPVFQQKAAELAGGEYPGEVTFRVSQPTDENPLERDSFDAEQWATLTEPLLDAGASLSVAFKLAGMDREEFEEELPEPDESDADLQRAAEAMGIGGEGEQGESESVPEEEPTPPGEPGPDESDE